MLVPTLNRKQTLLIVGGALICVAFMLWILTRYISPAPPKNIAMTTGAVDGASHQFALRYKTYLKERGVNLELLPSSGSVENLQRLNSHTEVGFVQGGLGILSLDPKIGEEDTPLRSLGVVGYEPVWLFASNTPELKTLKDGLHNLAGKKVAIGVQGSGTRKVALDLLQAYGIHTDNAVLATDAGLVSANALVEKKLDAVIIIGAPQSPAVQLLLDRSDIQLVSLKHAEGITRRLPYLSLVTLKAGSIDLLRNLPSQDIDLLTTTANLVVRDDLHPALTYLLLEAAHDIHKGASLLNKPAEFPHPRAADFPLAAEAQRYYKDGRPFFHRYLPYWAANAVQRILLILIPLMAILIPAIKTIPELLNFKNKTRLYRLYEVLIQIERDMRTRSFSGQDIDSAIARLEQIEVSIKFSKFPLEFSDRIYDLRQHVDFVRKQLEHLKKGTKV